MADSIDLSRKKVMSWRDCLDCGGLKVNSNKSKMIMSDAQSAERLLEMEILFDVRNVLIWFTKNALM